MWDDARTAMDNLHDALERETNATKQIRQLRDQINDREHQIVTGSRPAFIELSETAWNKKAKELFHDDPNLKELRQKIRDEEAKHDQAQADVKYCTTDCQMFASRMDELSGLLNFYAASKLVTRPAV